MQGVSYLGDLQKGEVLTTCRRAGGLLPRRLAERGSRALAAPRQGAAPHPRHPLQGCCPAARCRHRCRRHQWRCPSCFQQPASQPPRCRPPPRPTAGAAGPAAARLPRRRLPAPDMLPHETVLSAARRQGLQVECCCQPRHGSASQALQPECAPVCRRWRFCAAAAPLPQQPVARLPHPAASRRGRWAAAAAAPQWLGCFPGRCTVTKVMLAHSQPLSRCSSAKRHLQAHAGSMHVNRGPTFPSISHVQCVPRTQNAQSSSCKLSPRPASLAAASAFATALSGSCPPCSDLRCAGGGSGGARRGDASAAALGFADTGGKSPAFQLSLQITWVRRDQFLLLGTHPRGGTDSMHCLPPVQIQGHVCMVSEAPAAKPATGGC